MDESLKHAFADVDFAILREKLRGAEYRELVQQHLRKLGAKLEISILASVQAFDELERTIGEELIDEYNGFAFDFHFWHRDCGDVFDEICDRFGK